MADVTVKRVEECEGAFGGAFRKVRAGLGVRSFGLQVMDFPPGADGYPEHDHSSDGQEEVYTALSGSATITAGGEEHTLEPGVFVRVGPGVPRKIVTSGEPARILALGGVPGQAYEPPEFTEEGVEFQPSAQ